MIGAAAKPDHVKALCAPLPAQIFDRFRNICRACFRVHIILSFSAARLTVADSRDVESQDNRAGASPVTRIRHPKSIGADPMLRACIQNDKSASIRRRILGMGHDAELSSLRIDKNRSLDHSRCGFGFQAHGIRIFRGNRPRKIGVARPEPGYGARDHQIGNDSFMRIDAHLGEPIDVSNIQVDAEAFELVRPGI